MQNLECLEIVDRFTVADWIVSPGRVSVEWVADGAVIGWVGGPLGVMTWGLYRSLDLEALPWPLEVLGRVPLLGVPEPLGDGTLLMVERGGLREF